MIKHILKQLCNTLIKFRVKLKKQKKITVLKKFFVFYNMIHIQILFYICF